MTYKRIVVPDNFSTGAKLNRELIGIGMSFAGERQHNPNIEDTLIAASITAINDCDYRLLSVLTYWISIHSPWINVDRLYRILKTIKSEKILCYWSAIGIWLSSDRRFLKFKKLYEGKNIDLLEIGTDFQISRHGEDERFTGSKLRVPANLLRARTSDVLQPAQLSRVHDIYRYRILHGPTYRADMWAIIELFPELSAADLARKTYGSFATAWKVKHDWAILNAIAA
jgi:hypothetical protein